MTNDCRCRRRRPSGGSGRRAHMLEPSARMRADEAADGGEVADLALRRVHRRASVTGRAGMCFMRGFQIFSRELAARACMSDPLIGRCRRS